MTNKLFPISLMTFLAIYLFVFPYYVKPSEELQLQHHFISKALSQKAEEQKEINLKLHSKLRLSIKMTTANSFLTNWDNDLQNVFKLAFEELVHLKRIKDIEQRLVNTNTFIQHLPFGSYFKSYLLQFNLSRSKMETIESVSLAKKYIEIELLKMEAFYLEQILNLATVPDHLKPKNYLIKAKFNKPSYQIGEEMKIDLEFHESKIANFTNWDTLIINGKRVNKRNFRKDHVLINPEEYKSDSISIKYRMINPVTGETRTYGAEFRIK